MLTFIANDSMMPYVNMWTLTEEWVKGAERLLEETVEC